MFIVTCTVTESNDARFLYTPYRTFVWHSRDAFYYLLKRTEIYIITYRILKYVTISTSLKGKYESSYINVFLIKRQPVESQYRYLFLLRVFEDEKARRRYQALLESNTSHIMIVLLLQEVINYLTLNI